MKFLYALLVLQLLVLSMSVAQEKSVITGLVTDEQGNAIVGCHIHAGEVCVISDINGKFRLPKINHSPIQLHVTCIAYATLDTLISVQNNTIQFHLKEDVTNIGEVSVKANAIDMYKTQKNELVDADFINQNLDGNLAKSMSRIVGVNSIDIGANASKPIIRGMGFNRVVVSEDGIKQEGQQWGADHGLEMDPFAVESAELIKGGSSIEHGSGAIGGVLNVNNSRIPYNGQLNGEVSLLSKSVNNTFGGSLKLEQRMNSFFYKLRTSYINYADYSVPTDTIVYLTQKIPIYNNEVKNTAGNDANIFGQFGWIKPSYKTVFTVSDFYQKAGFFPGAHGVPSATDVLDDGDRRNIELPYQNVNHLKLLNNTRWNIGDNELKLELGYQHNHRQEWSEFHTHYPGQDAPTVDPDLEFDFKLQTLSANGKYKLMIDHHELVLGFQNQYLVNDVEGYNFFLPEYTQFTTGAYVNHKYQIRASTHITTGVRIDYGNYRQEAYFDSLMYAYILSQEGYTADEANEYATRADEIHPQFSGFSWQLGLYHEWNGNISSRLNIGKAFRMPTAVELGANGIHHGSFRYEKGDATLVNESGHFADINTDIVLDNFMLSGGLYIYYFQNFIYLQPTGDLNHPLPDAGAIYNYQQSKALLRGAELAGSLNIMRHMKISANFEVPQNYLINANGNLGYGIPYSPPINGNWELAYESSNSFRAFINGKWALKVDRTRGQGELITPGYSVYGGGLNYKHMFNKQSVNFFLTASNLLNTKYYNHISTYRNLDMPEMGRNVQLLVKIPMNIKK